MALQFGDVPAPQLIRPSGQQLRLLIRGVGELIAALTSFTLFIQDPVHRAQRTVIDALVQQRGEYRRGRTVLESFLVQTGEHPLPLRGTECPGRNCFLRWTEDGALLPIER